MELTILMPCLNEAETLGICIQKATKFIAEHGIHGEVLVADNGSTDGSQIIALAQGARVLNVDKKGYGAALMAGINNARGKYVIMGDSDDSYDFSSLDVFIHALRDGNELVMGNRFKGGISDGAMPFLHRYLGNPVLSFIGQLFFKVPIGDFHCGLRGFNREKIIALDLKSIGMEFASEMVVKSRLHNLKITEVPTILHVDGRTRSPHLRTWPDGWRHLKFLLLHSPRWLFLYPGVFSFLVGLALAIPLSFGPIKLAGNIHIDIHTFAIGCILILAGIQSISFSLLARRYAARTQMLPTSYKFQAQLERISMESLLIVSVILFLSGATGIFLNFFAWAEKDFGNLEYATMIKPLLLSGTAIVTGLQLAFTAFLYELIGKSES